MREVTIVGGGIAGLTAAITAAQSGAKVRVLERRAALGGRAQTTPPPYRANLGPHALYTNGAMWDWLERQNLLPATVVRGPGRIIYQHNGQLTDELPGTEGLPALLRAPATTELSFSSWAQSIMAPEAADALSAFAFISTFEEDAGRLSAAFVQERIRRGLQPGVVRYVIGGWENLTSRLAEAARELGVTIEERHHVGSLPPPPVVVATSATAAARLLPRTALSYEGTYVAIFDLALPSGPDLPDTLFDLDRRLYLARYTSFDRTLAPAGEELIQIVCGCRPSDRFADAHGRIDAVLDSLRPSWRDGVLWSRRSLLRGATGAVDLPGRSWRDRAPVKQGDGVFCAGDYLAAPGLLAEVSFSSGLEAGAFAATHAQA